MVAPPADTAPPVGKAWTFDPNASISDAARILMAKREFPVASPATAVAREDDLLPDRCVRFMALVVRHAPRADCALTHIRRRQNRSAGRRCRYCWATANSEEQHP
jgi:hypothetical protein